jgi:hypothetical protein
MDEESTIEKKQSQIEQLERYCDWLRKMEIALVTEIERLRREIREEKKSQDN